MTELIPLGLEERTKKRACPVGAQSFCCSICMMGPCRLVKDGDVGVCGAPQELVVARNVLRTVAAGTSAHVGHAIHLAHHLDKPIPAGYIKARAPEALYALWEQAGLKIPQTEAEMLFAISEALHMSTMGVNSDYTSTLLHALTLGIIDGYYGLHLATELEDLRYGWPEIRTAELNLDCIKPDKINIAVHGHEAQLVDAIVQATRWREDINVIGVCCTGAGSLAKYGIPLAAHFNLQEEVIRTRVIDAMVVDVQCIMPSIADFCECFRTPLITTNPIAQIPGAEHLPITNEAEAAEVARQIIAIAERRKAGRGATRAVGIGGEPKSVTVGFSENNTDIARMAELLERGEARGIIGVVGCSNPRAGSDVAWNRAYKKLSEDYIILTTGCMAFEFGKNDWLDGERFFHLGSCVNNARMAQIFGKVAEYLGKAIHELPFWVSAPRPITEKAMAIAMYFITLGCNVHTGYPFVISGNDKITSTVAGLMKGLFGTQILLHDDPQAFYEALTADDGLDRGMMRRRDIRWDMEIPVKLESLEGPKRLEEGSLLTRASVRGAGLRTCLVLSVNEPVLISWLHRGESVKIRGTVVNVRRDLEANTSVAGVKFDEPQEVLFF